MAEAKKKHLLLHLQYWMARRGDGGWLERGTLKPGITRGNVNLLTLISEEEVRHNGNFFEFFYLKNDRENTKKKSHRSGIR